MKNEYTKTRSIGIDAMRGISILYIVGFWHLFNYTSAFPSYNNFATIRITVIALGLFVFLSGYLIGAKYLDFSKSGLIVFYQKRIIRIYPPFIAAIGLFYALKISSGMVLVKSIFLVSMFFPPAPPTLWFVTMIFLYYMVTPLLVHIISSHGIKKYIMFCVLIMALCYAFRHDIDIRIAIYAPCFAAGVLMARYSILLRKINLGVVTVVLILSIAVSLNDISPVEHNFLSAPLALAGSLFLFVIFMRIENKLVTHRGLPWMIRLSNAGFFMYLFHRPLFKIFGQLYFPTSGAYQVMYLLLVCLPIIIAVSSLGQMAYDQLLSRLTRRSTGLAETRG